MKVKSGFFHFDLKTAIEFLALDLSLRPAEIHRELEKRGLRCSYTYVYRVVNFQRQNGCLAAS